MPYVYSTLTAPQEYTDWQMMDGGVNTIIRSIRIEGGHGVINKHFITPQGVATQVTEEELAFLQNNYSFKEHMKNGFIVVDKKKSDTERVVRDMKARDGSSQIVPDDYSKKGRKAPKIGPLGQEE